ncbi:MAG: carboxypeptidase-like regulatory domain-containing protein [Bacteroides sp.]|nr:carboxypeptidase-like regulatory domain-containing protein [Bacteroides sp.]
MLLASSLSASANSLGDNATISRESVKNVEQQHSRVIKGLVQDKNHEPIIGATVVAKGSTVGVLTDIDGLFTIE